jgi:hypothetical protein
MRDEPLTDDAHLIVVQNPYAPRKQGLTSDPQKTVQVDRHLISEAVLSLTSRKVEQGWLLLISDGLLLVLCQPNKGDDRERQGVLKDPSGTVLQEDDRTKGDVDQKRARVTTVLPKAPREFDWIYGLRW